MERAKKMADIGNLISGRDMTAKLGELSAFLATTPASATPSYEAMADQLDITVAELRGLLGKLEYRGQILFVSRQPPAIQWIDATADNRADLQWLPDPERYKRLLEADGERHRLGRFIGAYEQQHARGPGLRAMADGMDIESLPRVNRMAEILAERGLIHWKTGGQARLTDNGKQFYGIGKGAKKMEPTTKVVVPFVPSPRVSRTVTSRVPDLCRAIAEFQAENYGQSPQYRWLAKRLGYTATCTGIVGQIRDAAVAAGFIVQQPWRTHGFTFTDKGRQQFAPDAVTAAEVMRTPTPMPHPPAPPPPPPAPKTLDSILAAIPTPDLVLALIERGYIVKKG